MSRQAPALEIDEDAGFQRREWRLQRIGAALLGTFVIAAALGVTGMGGPVSRAEAGERGGPLFVEYSRVVRRGAKARMTLHIRGDSSGFIRFWLSAPYLEQVLVESVAPVPETATVESARRVYTIRAASPDVAVTVEMEHQTFGRRTGEVAIVGGGTVTIRQLSLF
jgi:hypothetical protein